MMNRDGQDLPKTQCIVKYLKYLKTVMTFWTFALKLGAKIPKETLYLENKIVILTFPLLLP